MSIMCREVYDNLPNVLLKQIEIMDSNVIFDVLRNVRFNVLGKVDLVTPTEFTELDENDRNELYNKIFDAVFDTTSALSALMTIEKNYRQLTAV